MSPLAAMGRLLLLAGVVLVAIGALLMLGARLPWLGRLPGDFRFQGKGWMVYLPLGTSLLVSLLVSLALWLLTRRR